MMTYENHMVCFHVTTQLLLPESGNNLTPWTHSTQKWS